MRILLVNNYDSYADLLAYSLWCVSGSKPTVVHNDAATAEALLAHGFDCVVLSPGPGHPQVPRDFGVCAELIQRCRVPLLGVCLGHQGIALAAGGRLVLASEVMHGKRSMVRHTGHKLFAGVPRRFLAMRYHSWVVDPQGLPTGVEILARAEDDGAVMALGLRGRSVVGVQFHPESVGTPWGRRLLGNFLRMRPAAARQGSNAPAAGAKAHPTPKKSLPRPTAPRQAPTSKTVSRKSAARMVVWRELAWREPEQVFARHYARRPYAFWLDSAAPGPDRRWSFMGAPAAVLRIHAGRTVRVTPQGSTILPDNLWQTLRDARGAPPEGADALPCPFAGGLVGYLGYELQRHGEDAVPLAEHSDEARDGRAGNIGPRRDDRQGAMQVCRRFLAFDHVARRVYAVASQHVLSAARDWLGDIEADWWKVWPDLPPLQLAGDCPPGSFWPPEVQPRIDRESYIRRIKEAQSLIRRGEVYEVCLSNRFAARGEIDSWHLYRTLRATHPAPYAAFLKAPDTSILSASPERFLTVDRAGCVTTEPIKGTRAHVGTSGSLHFQRRALRCSPKDQAELLMVVDLLRNDLARVARRGSVRMQDLFKLTNHPTVVQMSATITARLRAGCDVVDLLQACFPGGSITGSPKRRAMEVIHALENSPRGAYTGAAGYICAAGTMNMNVAIRTLEQRSNGVSFGAGGAVTADSDPDGEWDEMEAKAFAVARAINLALNSACGVLRSNHCMQ